MKELRVIIAGSRDFDDFPKLMNSSIEILTGISKNRDDLDRIRIISGTARGADKLGEQYAKIAGYELSKFPADWGKLGKRAGYVRNASNRDRFYVQGVVEGEIVKERIKSNHCR